MRRSMKRTRRASGGLDLSLSCRRERETHTTIFTSTSFKVFAINPPNEHSRGCVGGGYGYEVGVGSNKLAAPHFDRFLLTWVISKRSVPISDNAA